MCKMWLGFLGALVSWVVWGVFGVVWGCLRGVMIGVVYRAVMRCNIEHGGGLSLLLRVMMTPKYAFNLVKINSK